MFTSAVDLHLSSTAFGNAILDNGAIQLAGITTDIDNQSRNATNPDIGADEFTSTALCSSVNAGTLSTNAYSICSTQTIALSSNSTIAGGGITFAWQIAAISGGTYTDVSVGSGTATPI